MHRWLRLLHHRRLDETDVKRALGPGALQRLEARVAASERHHTGQIRVCIEAGLPLSYIRREAPARDRALAMFGKLRVWDTEHNNGVLIYLLLAERAIEIVTDRGLARHADTAHWQRVMATMREAFRAGQFEAGLNQAIDAVDALLRQHFPLAPGQVNPNELSNAPVVR
ncbi:MAG: TPM domain-containing protein [Burkholderiales bacterium]|nr:TPM domain-containing protein [Burkholderiales bacterium]MDE2625902.1 TPM domain-containing protein [Burkholderiales bacterium]